MVNLINWSLDTHRGYFLKRFIVVTSLEVQLFRMCTSNEGGSGLIPGQGIKIPHAEWPKIFFLKSLKRKILCSCMQC